MDLFNPDNFTAVNNMVQVKLLDPLSPERPSTSGEKGNLTLTRSGYFFAGWYQERTIRTQDGTPIEKGGIPVDENGKPLRQLFDGTFVYLNKADENEANSISEEEEETDSEEESVQKTVLPAYDYDKLWNFDTDKVEYELNSGIKEINLYAGWVRYYEFEYYYKVEGSTEDWKVAGTTSFDYKVTNQEGSVTTDHDNLFIPEKIDGAMSYSHKFQNNDVFNFPKVDGTTFKAAYTDKECLNQITSSYEHYGTLDVSTATAIDRVVPVYVILLEGERFEISSAEKLIEHANAKGYYEILNDLDFQGKEWPKAFSMGEFSGKFYGSEGNQVVIKNLSIAHNSNFEEDSFGGIFGKVLSNATIEDVAFENVVFDVTQVAKMLRDCQFGTFSGYIEEGATIDNVSLSNATLKLGKVFLFPEINVNLVANGTVDGITVTNKVGLIIYGYDMCMPEFNVINYEYAIKTDTVVVDEISGKVTFECYNTAYDSQEKEVIIQ